MTRTKQKQWRQTNDYQCSNCRSVSNSQILCCKCGKGFRLNHNRASCRVCDATTHLECTALSRSERERERLKQGLRSWTYCNLSATMAFSSPDVTIVHAAFLDRYDWEPLDALSFDHRPILITIQLPTEKLWGG